MPYQSPKRGAIPSPRSELASATPHAVVIGAPPNFITVPAHISMWGNDVHGDCVTAEEAFAKACNSPEIFIPESDVISWATRHGVLEGAGITQDSFQCRALSLAEKCKPARLHRSSTREKQGGAKMKSKLAVLIILAGCAAVPTFGQSTSLGQGVDLKVDCSHRVVGKLPTIGAALKVLPQAASNTITISGSCTENLLIQGFDHLTLITTTSAAINDASGGQIPVVDIEDSRRVTLQGFTINGGPDGVVCGNASVCFLTSNTIQSSIGQEGVIVSAGSRAFLTNNSIKNNGTRGLTVNEGSQVFSVNDTFGFNGDSGVFVNSGAFFDCQNSTVRNNGNDGVVLTDHSMGRIISCTISGNNGNGVTVQRGSSARFDSNSGPATVTANTGSGVLVRDLAFSFFSPGENITGNLGGTDVSCAPQFPATRGAFTNTGGGTTNCVEP